MKRLIIIQAIITLVVLVAAAFATLVRILPPKALPASAQVTEFSAERAIEHIKVIAPEPRLVGSSGFDSARDYVMGELAAMGLTPEIQRASLSIPDGFREHMEWPVRPARDVENIIARIDGTQTEEAIMLVSHLDTVPSSPGATDDGNGVAVLLETARALKAGPPLRNSVILLFTAPEETGFHGAFAFILEHPWIEDVKLVINFDAGGLTGPSELTNTSPDDGGLIRELAIADPYVYGNSDHGVGASDFEAFKYYGFSGYAFDYSWDRRTHSQLDAVENLNPSSIQHQGYHALSLARHFGNLASLEDPKDPDPVYFDVLRLMFVHYPTTYVIPIMLVVVLIFVGVVVMGFKRQVLTRPGIGLGLIVFVISLLTAPFLVRAVWALLSSTIPTYQVMYQGHAPNETTLMTFFALFAIAMTTTWYALVQRVREVSPPDLTIGAYAPLALVIVIMAIAMPQASYGSTWVGLFGFLAVGYWFYSMKEGQELFSAAQLVALCLAAVVAIVMLLSGFVSGFMGSETNDLLLPVIVFVLMLGVLVPQMHIITRPNRRWLPVTAWLAAAISLVAVLLA